MRSSSSTNRTYVRSSGNCARTFRPRAPTTPARPCPNATKCSATAGASRLSAMPKTTPPAVSWARCGPPSEVSTNRESAAFPERPGNHGPGRTRRVRLGAPADPRSAVERNGRHNPWHPRDCRSAPRKAEFADWLAGGAALDGVALRPPARAPAAAIGVKAAARLDARHGLPRVAKGAVVERNVGRHARLHARGAGYEVPHRAGSAGRDSLSDGGATFRGEVARWGCGAARSACAQALYDVGSNPRGARGGARLVAGFGSGR